MNLNRRTFATLVSSIGASAIACQGFAKDPKLVEPVHRVAIAPSITPTSSASPAHPLDRALTMAKDGLADCRKNVKDYTAILVKRERVGGELLPNEYMLAKVRNRKVANGKVVQPLSVYLHFLKPSTVKGREVIYVEGENEGNVVAHEGGFKGKFLPTVCLDPKGSMAMRGQRYPMTEIGIENLMVKLIERGITARKQPDVEVEVRRNAKIKDRQCTVLQVTQPTRSDELEFYRAQVFMDDELNLPIRYVAYDWPRTSTAAPNVLEEYTYLNLKVNVGLTDKDFDPYNEAYNFYSK